MRETPNARGEPIGRYVLHTQIASGGMASVHLGRLIGAAGFARTVAIKRLHPHLARDPQFVSSFVDEARLAACVRHPNVVSTLDVVTHDDEILVVMEYVQGESLSRLLANGRPPLAVVVAVASQMLAGLHAAHEATSPSGAPLKLVHRDVSPQNVVVGVDGVTRLVDFGVAKASWRMQDTRDGALKGKVGYMAPEQLNWRPLDRRADVFSASVVLWEALTGRRLFKAESPDETVRAILAGAVAAPSAVDPALPPALDAIVLRGLAATPAERYSTASEMAAALEAVHPPATPREVGAWVADGARETLAARAQAIRELEQSTTGDGRSTSHIGAAVGGTEDLVTEPPARRERSAGGEPTLANGRAELDPSAHVASQWVRWRVAGGLLAAALVSVAALSIARTATTPTPRASASPAAAPGKSPAQLPSASPPASRAPAQLAPPAVEESAKSPAPLAPAAASDTPVRRERPPNSKPLAPRPPKAPSCNPPYTVGPDGIRRFRPECI